MKASASVVLGALVLYVATAAAQTARLERLMRDKLAYSQQALAEVVTSDWDDLERDARRLIAVTDNPEWMVLKTPDYERFSTEFTIAANGLLEAAISRNLDEAGLAYADLTVRCVNCHRYVNRARLAR